MKYHEKNKTSRFMISLAFSCLLVAVVIFVPFSRFYVLVDAFFK